MALPSIRGHALMIGLPAPRYMRPLNVTKAQVDDEAHVCFPQSLGEALACLA